MWEEVSISGATADFDFSVIGLSKTNAYHTDEKKSRSFAAKNAAQDDKKFAATTQSRALAFSAYSQERSQAEPGKRERKTNRNCDSAGGRSPRCVLGVFTNESDSAEGRHRQKDGAGYLQPQKMKDVAERPRGRANCGHGGIEPPVAARHVANHA